MVVARESEKVISLHSVLKAMHPAIGWRDVKYWRGQYNAAAPENIRKS
jgi:hypothetical protein